MTTASAASAKHEADSRYKDAERFCRRVRASAYFAAGRPIAVARAPGRLDVLGGIADYSGGLVLELPLRAATLAAVQRSDDRLIVAVSGGRRTRRRRRRACNCAARHARRPVQRRRRVGGVRARADRSASARGDGGAARTESSRDVGGSRGEGRRIVRRRRGRGRLCDRGMPRHRCDREAVVSVRSARRAGVRSRTVRTDGPACRHAR